MKASNKRLEGVKPQERRQAEADLFDEVKLAYRGALLRTLVPPKNWLNTEFPDLADPVRGILFDGTRWD